MVPATLALQADVVALVKPQFEAGRDDVGEGGLVLDPAVHERVVDEIRAAARAVGLEPVAMTPSPITGATGNQEFLLHLRSRPMSVRRVGIIAKEGLTAAAPHLAAVAGWLHARGVETIFEIKTAALAGLSNEPTLARDQLIAQVDLLLVLGGDGTMLGTAARVGEAGLPNADPWRELRPAGVPDRGHARGAVSGARGGARRASSQIHERRLLHATTLRAGSRAPSTWSSTTWS